MNDELQQYSVSLFHVDQAIRQISPYIYKPIEWNVQIKADEKTHYILDRVF